MASDSFPICVVLIQIPYRSLCVPPFCFSFNSRKTRSIAWESAQLSTWVKFMAYGWLSLNRLGNTGSRGRSKNNLRGIMMGMYGASMGDYHSYVHLDPLLSQVSSTEQDCPLLLSQPKNVVPVLFLTS